MAVSKDFLVIYRYFAASVLFSEDECAKQGREMLLFSTNTVALNSSQPSVGRTIGNMNLLASEKKTSRTASTQRPVLSSRRAACTSDRSSRVPKTCLKRKNESKSRLKMQAPKLMDVYSFRP